MSDYTTEPCRSCAAPVIWVRTEAGKAMPVDAEPTETGTVALSQPAGVLLARVLKTADRFGRTDLRTSHFATCPQAPAWRRKRSTS